MSVYASRLVAGGYWRHPGHQMTASTSDRNDHDPRQYAVGKRLASPFWLVATVARTVVTGNVSVFHGGKSGPGIQVDYGGTNSTCPSPKSTFPPLPDQGPYI